MSLIPINKYKKVYLPEVAMEAIEHNVDVADQMVAYGKSIEDSLKAINARFDSVNEKADFAIAELARIKAERYNRATHTS